MDLIKAIENEQLKENMPKFKIGDIVKVSVKIKEGTRERIQIFEGVVIKRQNGGSNETFTVRKISYGIGVERTFPVHSPKIEDVEVVRESAVRRAKLYYLRDKIGKAAKPKEKKKETTAKKPLVKKAPVKKTVKKVVKKTTTKTSKK